MPREDQYCYVRAKRYPGLENARKACLVGKGKDEIVGWQGENGREERKGEELWPDQDWEEEVGERWCLECERWHKIDELTVKVEGKKGWKGRMKWFVSCPDGHNFFQTKKRLDWVLGLEAKEIEYDKVE